jgi:two-component system, chemotaxis family, response regulator PixG
LGVDCYCKYQSPVKFLYLFVMSNLSQQLELWGKQQLTGRLDVQGVNLPQSSFYYCMGRLVWARGGIHPQRRWYRFASQFYPQSLQQFQREVNSAVAAAREYDLLIQWVKQQQIAGERAAYWVRSNITEVVFDLLQQEQLEAIVFTHEYQDSLPASLTLLSPEKMLETALQHWEVWNKAKLAQVSPNLAPVIAQADSLKETLSPQIYQKMSQVIDGQNTLRDIAVQMSQEVLSITRTLLPYVQQGLIKLMAVPDRVSPETPLTQSSLAASPALMSISLTPPPAASAIQPAVEIVSSPAAAIKTSVPLVAYVDDSRWETLKMERIVMELGYRFLALQDPMRALSQILTHKPDLIFLDLVMPIVNGYELCSQIRRIGQFKNTPIIVVTSNDGIVDRMRAKLVGATDFMTKPVLIQQVQGAFQKFFPS